MRADALSGRAGHLELVPTQGRAPRPQLSEAQAGEAPLLEV